MVIAVAFGAFVELLLRLVSVPMTAPWWQILITALAGTVVGFLLMVVRDSLGEKKTRKRVREAIRVEIDCNLAILSMMLSSSPGEPSYDDAVALMAEADDWARWAELKFGPWLHRVWDANIARAIEGLSAEEFSNALRFHADLNRLTSLQEQPPNRYPLPELGKMLKTHVRQMVKIGNPITRELSKDRE